VFDVLECAIKKIKELHTFEFDQRYQWLHVVVKQRVFLSFISFHHYFKL